MQLPINGFEMHYDVRGEGAAPRFVETALAFLRE
jgi:hypothetical protein